MSGLLGVIVGILASLGLRPGPSPRGPDPDRDLVMVVSTALDRGDDFWGQRIEPRSWRMPHVVFENEKGEATPCGQANATSGPFYCPANERIYLELTFLRSINGELARAYVIAHELGHHVQKMLAKFRGARDSIGIELQADCYAGMWMKDELTSGHLAKGDIEAALAEASAVGDDAICPGCSPEAWTHGSSKQRVAAVTEGLGGGPCM